MNKGLFIFSRNENHFLEGSVVPLKVTTFYLELYKLERMTWKQGYKDNMGIKDNSRESVGRGLHYALGNAAFLFYFNAAKTHRQGKLCRDTQNQKRQIYH